MGSVNEGVCEDSPAAAAAALVVPSMWAWCVVVVVVAFSATSFSDRNLSKYRGLANSVMWLGSILGLSGEVVYGIQVGVRQLS